MFTQVKLQLFLGFTLHKQPHADRVLSVLEHLYKEPSETDGETACHMEGDKKESDNQSQEKRKA